jgi:SAM-dependent methyltransferase
MMMVTMVSATEAGKRKCPEIIRMMSGDPVERFEPAKDSTSTAEVLRAQFLRQYFSIAESEYGAATSPVVRTLEEIIARKPGVIRILDVGCGQGHLMEQVLARIGSAGRDRVVIDYLDPQSENLRLYAERVPVSNIGRGLEYRWEDFSDTAVDVKYDLILVFQSLWSYDLAANGRKLEKLRDFLEEGGTALIGHSLASSAYVTILRNLGHLFHDPIPRLNTAEDVEAELRRQNISYTSYPVPVHQTFSAANPNFFTYLAANLYLISERPVMERWAELERSMENYRNESGQYQFDQDILFLQVRP